MTAMQMKSLDRFQTERGIVFVVWLPGEWRDTRELKGREVEIDGDTFEILGVDTYAHAPPFGRENVSMLVKPLARAP